MAKNEPELRPEYIKKVRKIIKQKPIEIGTVADLRKKYLGRLEKNKKIIKITENILKKANNLLTREQLKKKIPIKITTQTLNITLKYLENSGKILDGRKGILWIYTPSAKLEKIIKKGVEV